MRCLVQVVTRGALQPPTTVGADTQVQDMEEGSESESEGEEDESERSNDVSSSMMVPPPPPPPVPKDTGPKLPPLPPNPDSVIIRKDYDPKAPKMMDAVRTLAVSFVSYFSPVCVRVSSHF